MALRDLERERSTTARRQPTITSLQRVNNVKIVQDTVSNCLGEVSFSSFERQLRGQIKVR